MHPILKPTCWLRLVMAEFLQGLSLSHALRFGIESAYLHYWCTLKNTTIQEFLGIARVEAAPISFSIPIIDTGRMKTFYEENRLQRFRYIKIKVNADEMLD